MNRKLKTILIILLVLIVAGFAGYKYVMTGGARDLASENADFIVTSKSISTEFSNNIETSNKKYLEKAVEIKGTVSNVEANKITLDGNIICDFQKNEDSKKGDMITIKGRVTGFDDLMGELRLDQCSIIK